MGNLSNFLKMIGEFIQLNQWVSFVFGGIVGFFLNYFLHPYMKKSAENIADIQFTKLKSYLEEKGKNNATKEDIKDITNEIESVKSEISYANQRKYERILDQEKCLIDIAYYANLIGNMHSKLYVYLTYQTDRSKIDKFLEDLDGYLSSLIYNRNRAHVLVKDAELQKLIDALLNQMNIYSAELFSKAANAGLLLDSCIELQNAMKNFDFSPKEKIKMMKEISNYKDELRDLQDTPINHDEETLDALSDYLIALKAYLGKNIVFSNA